MTTSPTGQTSDRQDQTDSTLRLAVAMRGGVSLAIWIGGGLAEIDTLRRASIRRPVEPDSSRFVSELLALTRFHRVELDILTGASAGGLNAALGSACLSRGLPIAKLKDTWMTTADIDPLLEHDSTPEGQHVQSVLNGFYFLNELKTKFGEIRGRDLDAEMSSGSEAFLALTVLDGVRVRSAVDPLNKEARRSAFAHLRHNANDAAFSDLVAAGGTIRASKVARATASFPVAFEPVKVVTSELSGILHVPDPGLDPVPESLYLYDGGVLDNIPVARAIRAVGTAAATGPVRRWLLFLHPSPDVDSEPSPKPGESNGVGNDKRLKPKAVVTDFLGAASETLLDDLDVLVEHNRSVEVDAIQSVGLLRYELFQQAPLMPVPQQQLAASDADRLYELLLNPEASLTWSPIGQGAPPSPIANFDQDARLSLRMRLLNDSLASATPVRPMAQMIRFGLFLIDWIRWTEGRVPADFSLSRRRIYDLLLLARLVEMNVELAVLATPTATIDDSVNTAREMSTNFGCDPVLVSIAQAVVSDTDDPDLQWVPLVERLAGQQQEALRTLAKGTHVPNPSGELPGMIDVMQDQFSESFVVIADQAFPAGGNESMFTVLRDYLASESAAGRTVSPIQVLARVDQALAGLHRGGTSAKRQSLKYLRISGANRSPLADAEAVNGILPRFDSERALKLSDGQMSPKGKLSGNSLKNFSAFLSARFRENDWMWGRLDTAASLVELLIRKEHFLRTTGSTDIASVDTIVNRIQNALTAPGPAQLYFVSIWTSVRDIVHAEVSAVVNGSVSPLSDVKDLLTARWQLDILLESVPLVAQAKLLPDDEPHEWAPQAIATKADIQSVLTKYEDLPRQFGDVWGSPRVAVRGVQVARHLAGSLFPASRWKRILTSVPLMVTVAAVSLRGKFLLGLNLLLLSVPIPSLSPAWRAITIALSVAFSIGYWRTFVRRKRWDKSRQIGDQARYKRKRLRAHVVLGLSMALHVATGLVLWKQQHLLVAEKTSGSFTKLFRQRVVRLPPKDPAVMIVAIAVGSAVVLMWWWAKKRWRFGFAVVIGALLGAWTWITRWVPPPKNTRDFLDHVFRIFHGRITPVVVSLVAITVVAALRQPERKRPDS